MEIAWRDGFSKGVDGRDEMPKWSDLDPREVKNKVDPEYASQLPFNPEKCCARKFVDGYGVQCTFSHLDGAVFCTRHQTKFDGLPEGLDVPFGRYNAERPTHDISKPEAERLKPHAWADTKPERSKRASPSAGGKMGVKRPGCTAKSMRDELTAMGVSIDGLKGKNLTVRYNEIMDENSSESDEVEQTVEQVVEQTVGETVEQTVEQVVEQVVEQIVEQVVEQTVEQTVEQVVEEKVEEEKLEEEKVEEEKLEEQVVEQTVEQTVEQNVEEKVEEEKLEEEDDGMGTGLKPEYPLTISGFKKLFSELDIPIEGLKGKPAYMNRYDEYLEEKKGDGEETEDMSDDELEEDTSNYSEIDHDGVEYLEDEDSGKIYNLNHQHVGAWNEDCSEIIWANDAARIDHESKCE